MGPESLQEKTCATCRFAATDKRPKIIGETGFDDQLMFDDTDETVYSCRAYADSYTITMIGDKGEPDRVMEGQPLPVDETGKQVKLPLCGHAGKTIGLVPISCSAWAPSQTARAAELDALEARYAERMKARPKKDRDE